MLSFIKFELHNEAQKDFMDAINNIAWLFINSEFKHGVWSVIWHKTRLKKGTLDLESMSWVRSGVSTLVPCVF